MNRSLLLLVLLLPLLPAVAAGQGFAVDGRVVDAVTGVPLARATVSLEVMAEASASPRNRRPAAGSSAVEEVTASEGRFHFAGLPAGKYQLRASRRGYLTSSLEEHGGFFAAVLVGPGEPPAVIRFPLLPLASIGGTVLDSTGDPVQGATVSLFMESFDGTGSVRSNQTTSLQRGGSTYEFHSLAPGTYYVAVTARPWFAENSQGGEGASDPLDVAYPVTFYPGAESEATAQPIALQPGEQAEADFALHAVPAVHINIPVENGIAPGLTAPAFGTALPLGMGAMRQQQAAGDEASLVFSMAVAPGVYSMRRGAEATAIDATGAVTVPAPSAELPAAPLSGRLAMADGSPLPAATTLHLFPGDAGGGNSSGLTGAFFGQRGGGFAGGGGRLGGRGGNPGLARRPLQVTVGADGSFALEAVGPGDYHLDISAGQAGTLVVTAAAIAGAQGSSVQDLPAFHMGTEPVMLAATVALATSSVSGRVMTASGRAESGDMVLLVPQDPAATMLYKQEESNSDGSWSIAGVTAGVYRVLAIRDGWSLAWRKPEVLSRYLGSAGSVTVPVNGRAVVEQPLVGRGR